MNDVSPLLIAEKAPQFTLDSVRFLNLTLDKDRIKYIFDPIIASMCKNIEFSFKSPAKIELISTAGAKHQQLLDCLQFDDICIRLFHVDSAKDFFLIFQSRFARILLMRLLSAPLQDESASLYFSATEKGIFSFILARLLIEMKKTLQDRMPNLKLLGIFHALDESIKEFQVSQYGACNFLLTFAGEQFPAIVFCPTEIFELSFDRPTRKSQLFARCGHIKHQLSFKVHRLKMRADTLYRLSFGDLILFDHSDLKLQEGVLTGSIAATWRGLCLYGSLSADEKEYRFTLSSGINYWNGEGEMEELEISGAKNSTDSEGRILELAKNLRVEISIELSRVPMNLKEICELKAGEIIDLHRKIDDPLEIVLEGKVIGYCAPVQIDGRLGIRILSIESDVNQPQAV